VQLPSVISGSNVSHSGLDSSPAESDNDEASVVRPSRLTRSSSRPSPRINTTPEESKVVGADDMPVIASAPKTVKRRRNASPRSTSSYTPSKDGDAYSDDHSEGPKTSASGEETVTQENEAGEETVTQESEAGEETVTQESKAEMAQEAGPTQYKWTVSFHLWDRERGEVPRRGKALEVETTSPAYSVLLNTIRSYVGRAKYITPGVSYTAHVRGMMRNNTHCGVLKGQDMERIVRKSGQESDAGVLEIQQRLYCAMWEDSQSGPAKRAMSVGRFFDKV
jgi:hypothetical protein